MDKASQDNSSKVGPAKVRCGDMSMGQFSGEVVVTIHAVRGPLTAIFPLSSVDRASGTVDVVIIGEEGDRYLVDLPTNTFTSGSKAWFPKELCIV